MSLFAATMLLLGPVDGFARDSRCTVQPAPGKAQEAGAASAAQPVNTNLDEISRNGTALRLAGLFTYANGEGLAIVEIESKDSEVFSVGEIVIDDVCLEELLLRGAIIYRQGRYEVLPLQSAEGFKGGGSISASLPMAQNSVAPDVSDGGVPTAGDDAGDVNGRKAMILADAAIAAPYVENGVFSGLIIYNGQNPELLNQVGLQSGDIIVSIGDIELTDEEDGFSRLESLSSGDLVSLLVVRDNQRIPFSFLLP